MESEAGKGTESGASVDFNVTEQRTVWGPRRQVLWPLRSQVVKVQGLAVMALQL